MTKPTLRTVSSAAAIAAAMMFGASAMAQTPPGSSNPKNEATMPAPSPNAAARSDTSGTAAVTGAGVTADTSVDARAAAKAQNKETRKAMRDERAVKKNSNNDSVGNLGVPATKGDGKS